MFIKDTQFVYLAASDSRCRNQGCLLMPSLTGKTGRTFLDLAKNILPTTGELLATGVPVCGIIERRPTLTAPSMDPDSKRPLYDDSGRSSEFCRQPGCSDTMLEEEAKNFPPL